MGSLIRRLLWLGPSLVVVTLVAFGVLSSALPAQGPRGRLPLFFNPDPGAIERLSRRALDEIAENAASADEAMEELARLGGAALPFVLPVLDSLRPEARARVVQALEPVRRRMGFATDDELADEKKFVFWARFWQEHSIDFRPIVAERAVVRYATRSTPLREAEVRRLDTYALDQLVRRMPPVESAEDVERVERLSRLASEIATRPAEVRPALGGTAEGSLEAARSTAMDWEDWWGNHRTRFKTYRGTERITAMLTDTRYGGWVAQAVRRRLGLLRDGRTAGDVLFEGGLVTLPLLLSGVLGGWVAGVLWSALGALAMTRGVRGFELFGVALAALPVAGLAAVVMSLAPDEAGLGVGVALMLLSGAPLMSLYRSAVTRPRATQRFVRTLRALGVSRWTAGVATIKLSSPAIVAQIGAQVSGLLTLAFVVEFALDLPGLGTRTIVALRHPDLNWLMAIAVSTALFVGLLQALSEWLLEWLDPRAREAWGGAGDRK